MIGLILELECMVALYHSLSKDIPLISLLSVFSQASSSDPHTHNSVQTNLLALHLHRAIVHFVF